MDLICEKYWSCWSCGQQIGKVDKKIQLGHGLNAVSFQKWRDKKIKNYYYCQTVRGGQWSEDISDVLSLPNFPIKRLKIPKCTTSEGQPLDVVYNIFFK